jgi:hypothetical protein
MPTLPHRVFVLLAACLVGWLLATAQAQAAGIDDPIADTVDPVQEQGRRVVIEVRAGAAEIVKVGVGGVVRQGGDGLPLRRATATVAPGSKAKLELRPRYRRHERRILRALRKGKTLVAPITFRFEDILGNVGKRTKTIKLT